MSLNHLFMHQTDLNEDADTRLHHHCCDGGNAVRFRVSKAVSYGVLRLDREQQGRSEIVDASDATFLPLVTESFGRRKVAVDGRYHPPDDGENDPADDKRRCEHDDVPTPPQVDDGREQVRQVAPLPVGHVPSGDVARAVLEDQAARLLMAAVTFTASVCGRRSQR